MSAKSLKIQTYQEASISLKVNNKINEAIRATEIRVISSSGEQLGIMSKSEAIKLAAEEGLDLVEIAGNVSPSVAKIIDFGKFKYEKEKAHKESKKKQKIVVVKEIKIRPQIDTNDLDIKMKRIKEFLSEDKKVKVVLVLRGRQRLYADKGKDLLENLAKSLEDIATVERNYKAGFSLYLSARRQNENK